MKLSTRSCYGARLMLDLAQHYDEGFTQLGEVATRQDISVKYLEQIIIPLKKGLYVKSARGAKGGHMLTRPPNNITVGEIVALLEAWPCETPAHHRSPSLVRVTSRLTGDYYHPMAARPR